MYTTLYVTFISVDKRLNLRIEAKIPVICNGSYKNSNRCIKK